MSPETCITTEQMLKNRDFLSEVKFKVEIGCYTQDLQGIIQSIFGVEQVKVEIVFDKTGINPDFKICQTRAYLKQS